jgi:hypothetical protein
MKNKNQITYTTKMLDEFNSYLKTSGWNTPTEEPETISDEEAEIRQDLRRSLED